MTHVTLPVSGEEIAVTANAVESRPALRTTLLDELNAKPIEVLQHIQDRDERDDDGRLCTDTTTARKACDFSSGQDTKNQFERLVDAGLAVTEAGRMKPNGSFAPKKCVLTDAGEALVQNEDLSKYIVQNTPDTLEAEVKAAHRRVARIETLVTDADSGEPERVQEIEKRVRGLEQDIEDVHEELDAMLAWCATVDEFFEQNNLDENRPPLPDALGERE